MDLDEEKLSGKIRFTTQRAYFHVPASEWMPPVKVGDSASKGKPLGELGKAERTDRMVVSRHKSVA
ncbi:MAG: hypothetical protein HY787_18545 [Deltaproteobacteria bacterium]|nr:hypothetical protein [Deltaproteobacteria bacterium]